MRNNIRKQIYNDIMDGLSHSIYKSLNEMASISIFNQFDDVDIFNNNFYIVMKDGKYNLMDRSGQMISDKWFEKIEKSDDEKTIKMKTKEGSSIKVNNDIKQQTFQKIANAFNANVVKNMPDIMKNCEIEIVNPFKIGLSWKETEKEVTIVAKVKYEGKELLLSEDGKLYTLDSDGYGSEYKPSINKQNVSKNTSNTNNRIESKRYNDYKHIEWTDYEYKIYDEIIKKLYQISELSEYTANKINNYWINVITSEEFTPGIVSFLVAIWSILSDCDPGFYNDYDGFGGPKWADWIIEEYKRDLKYVITCIGADKTWKICKVLRPRLSEYNEMKSYCLDFNMDDYKDYENFCDRVWYKYNGNNEANLKDFDIESFKIIFDEEFTNLPKRWK